MSNAAQVLSGLLSIAVPLRIEEIKARGGITTEDLVRVKGYQQALAEHGDDLLYKSKKEGGSAERFNQVADIMAVFSFLPGGITLFGLHFETKYPEAQTESED